MLVQVEKEGLILLSAPDLEESAGVVVAFTDRRGGSSAGPCQGLNLSYNVGDSRASVAANREEVARAIDVPVTRWVLGMQVHGRAVAQVSGADAGRGGADHVAGIPRTDALLTRTPGVALAVLTADCVPLILVAPDAPAVAVVHAGWRGTLAGIAAAGAKALARCAGCEPPGVLVFIGPHIGPCCMEVGSDIASRFASEFGSEAVSGRNLDLAEACAAQMAAVGVSRSNMFGGDKCTRCSDDYFSHRRDERCGRQGAFVAIKGD